MDCLGLDPEKGLFSYLGARQHICLQLVRADPFAERLNVFIALQ
jgi:hypothetical protein